MVKVLSGRSLVSQLWRWMRWWWNEHSSTKLSSVCWPPSIQVWMWWASHRQAGVVAVAGAAAAVAGGEGAALVGGDEASAAADVEDR